MTCISQGYQSKIEPSITTQTIHASTYRLRSVQRVIDASNWRSIDQAGFRVAIAAYLVDPIDASIDSMQPQLLRFKLADSLRKAVRSVKLSKFFKRDHVKQSSVAISSRPNECAGPHAEKMASVLKDVFKSRSGRTQSQHALRGGIFEVCVVSSCM